jgi:hypothetical protein
MAGLTKRVRGANAPLATNAADAFCGGQTSEGLPPPSADSVASFLSEFSKGVERGLDERIPGEGDR